MSDRSKAMAHSMAQFIQEVTSQTPLFKLLAANKYWDDFLSLYITAERRGILGEPVVLLALRNLFIAGRAEAVNSFGELTQLGGARPPSKRTRQRSVSELDIIKHLMSVDQTGKLKRLYEAKVAEEFGDAIGRD
jgi:hypothetical protein